MFLRWPFGRFSHNVVVEIDSCRAKAVAVAFGGLGQALHLVVGQILACADIGFLGPNCMETVRFLMAGGAVFEAVSAMFYARFVRQLFV